MNSFIWLILLFINVIIAYLIAKYQEANGYTFSKSFIGAIIGVVGLTLLAIKGWYAL